MRFRRLSFFFVYMTDGPRPVQVYQSEFLVGSKMMTISSFGPDSVASAPWRAGKGGKVTNTRSAAITPEAMMPEVGWLVWSLNVEWLGPWVVRWLVGWLVGR